MPKALEILSHVRACKVCEPGLPDGAKPLVAASRASRIVLIGQAPGRIAHQSGVPWNDRSGEKLREWLGVERDCFYNPEKMALMPMGFCYPGTGATGDFAPRPECAPLWHDQILAKLPNVRLRVFIGQYPLARYFPNQFRNLTEAVQAFDELLPAQIVLPHPSPRNAMWLARNPWFVQTALPRLRAAVKTAL
ncbi:MAG: uracil-DNA glycosylase family protein [Bryobacteraceae bacterium]|nr:uracil-DNA glycosylase family protein [Bryobacteraceae bacterium]